MRPLDTYMHTHRAWAGLQHRVNRHCRTEAIILHASCRRTQRAPWPLKKGEPQEELVGSLGSFACGPRIYTSNGKTKPVVWASGSQGTLISNDCSIFFSKPSWTIDILQIKSYTCLKGKKVDKLITRWGGQLLHTYSVPQDSTIRSETKKFFLGLFIYIKYIKIL